jgi:hypothetical protein
MIKLTRFYHRIWLASDILNTNYINGDYLYIEYDFFNPYLSNPFNDLLASTKQNIEESIG